MVRAQGLQLVLFRKQRSKCSGTHFLIWTFDLTIFICSPDSLTLSCPWTAVQWLFARTARLRRTSSTNSCWVTRSARRFICAPTRCKTWWSGSRPWTLRPQRSLLAVVRAAPRLVARPPSPPAPLQTACPALRPPLPRWRVRWSWQPTTTTWMWIIARRAMRDSTRLAHQSKDSNSCSSWTCSPKIDI